jgi:zinc protease
VEGIKVIFKPTIKDVISVRMYFRGGVANYAQPKAGIEHLTLGATAECGTKKYDANQFKDIADQYGVEIGGSADYDYGDINMICISKYFNQGWDLFAQAVTAPVFNDKEVQLLKNKLLADIKQRESDPDSKVEHLLMQNAFRGTIYATDPKGTEASVSALTALALKEHYHELLNKNRMFIVVAGRISQQELTEKIKASFAAIPTRPYQPLAYQTPVWNDNKLVAENRSLATNYVNAVMNAPAMASPDYIPFHMGISALSGSLFSEVRTKRNLSYAPGAYAANMLMPYAVMYVSTPSPKEAVAVMMDQLNTLKKVGITSSGLKELKSSFITSTYVKQQQSNAITGALGQAEIMGDWKLSDSAADKVEEVTADQILKAINKYIVGIRWAYLGDITLANQSDSEFRIPVR